MRKNTFDTVIFTWHDPRLGTQRTFDTSLRKKNIVVTDIKGIDDWTISREWIGDPETAMQLEITHTWDAVAFEIEGVVVDNTKKTDEILRAWSKTSEVVHMHVVGFEQLDRDFYISAFELARYGNVRPFTISCVDAAGHIRAVQSKVIDMTNTEGRFEFPFENLIGDTFDFGYSVFASSAEIHSNSFVKEEPFTFTGVFADTASAFELSNDLGQTFRIDYDFQSEDILTIDTINRVFRLMRGGTQIPILTSISYINSSLFGIRQGDQTISILEVPLQSATIIFREHLA